MDEKKKLELYIHIPFCVRKCAYCDFLSAPAGRETQKAYVEALIREIGACAETIRNQYEVCSVFFGGGTPSLLPAEEISAVMKALRRGFVFAPETEISLECNPGTADAEKLRCYKLAGINRLSFGLQSADNEELRLLGRIHTWETFQETYHQARAAGFSNINVDLMSALPGQTVRSWEETLRRVLALDPEHISAYSLIIEEGTPFYETYAADAQRREDGEQPEFLPSEDDEREMYRLTEQLLGQAGMHRYEISNYAKAGYECRHNIGYWDGTEYLGFGLGASSMLLTEEESAAVIQSGKQTEANKPDVQSEKQMGADGPDVQTERTKTVCVRFRNTGNLLSYLQGDGTDREAEVLTEQDRMAEFMFLGLRMTAGVSEEEFRGRFGIGVEDAYGAILERCQSFGLLARGGGRIWLTARGLDVSNMVMAEFV